MKKNICIVVANYYPAVSKDLIDGASKVLNRIGVKTFKKIIVPGVFEIPFTISKNINNYDAFIALGCIIKGETPHFDLISKAAIDGIMKLSIEYKKPIGNGIITCLNLKQAIARQKKGQEAAAALLSVLNPVKVSAE